MASEVNYGVQSGCRRDGFERAFEIRPPEPGEALSRLACYERRLSIEHVVLIIFAVVAVGCAAIASVSPLIFKNWPLFGSPAIHAVVERIIRAESNGHAALRNSRSSAAGAAQFLDGTWLDAIRVHRRDLFQAHSEKELLEWRSKPALVREMVARTVERNAATFRKRGLPVTAGTLYLAHFAGTAGAVALLTVSDDMDAASVMAKADASGRSTRAKLVKANPFLETFTVGDLKLWADRKMRG